MTTIYDAIKAQKNFSLKEQVDAIRNVKSGWFVVVQNGC